MWEPELLERQGELDHFAAVLTRVQDGEGLALSIEALAGMGKTRLVRELRTRARAAGMGLLSARATELERSFAFGVVHQLFDGLIAQSTPAERRSLLAGAAAAARPALDLVTSGSPAHTDDRDDVSFSSLNGLFWLTANVSRRAPLVLTVDDAQWADAASLRFVHFLTTRLEGLPILVLVAHRPAEAGETGDSTRVLADTSLDRIVLSPLGPGSTASILEAALGEAPEASFVTVCHERSGGNPFLITQTAKALAGGGIRPTASNVPALIQTVPGSVTDAVLGRLASLPAAASELARALAILGDGCELRQVAELAGLGQQEARDAADALRGADLLGEEHPLRFVHPLVRSAVHAAIPVGARSREHERAALLLASHGAPPQRLAIHLLATEPQGKAQVASTLGVAARAALTQGAPGSALVLLRRALAEPPEEGEREALLELLVVAAARAADFDGLAGFEDDLLATLSTDGARSMRAAAPLARWLSVSGAGRTGQAAEILHAAIEAADGAGDLDLAVALEAQLIAHTQVPPPEAKARLARYASRVAKDTPAQRLALALEAWWTSALGEPAPTAVRLARQALSGGQLLVEQLDLPAPSQAILVLARGDALDAAEAACGELIEAASARGATGTLAGGWFLRGYTAYRRGDLTRAQADARQSVDVARQRGFLGALPLFSALLVDVLVQRGELEAAERELSACGFASDVPDGYWLASVLFSRGRLRLAQGRLPEAAGDFRELRDRLGRWGFVASPGLPAAGYAAVALERLGERDQARELAAEELAAAKRWQAPSAVGEALMLLGIVTAGDAGIGLLDEAVRVLASGPARLLQATALVEQGTLLRRERRRSDARDPLRAGLDMARRCGAVVLARRAADELEASGEKPERHTPIGVDALTPSERRVAEMAADGMTNREIAVALYVTIKTVESHLRAAYDKLGIRSRRDLQAAVGAQPS